MSLLQKPGFSYDPKSTYRKSFQKSISRGSNNHPSSMFKGNQQKQRKTTSFAKTREDASKMSILQ